MSDLPLRSIPVLRTQVGENGGWDSGGTCLRRAGFGWQRSPRCLLAAVFQSFLLLGCAVRTAELPPVAVQTEFSQQWTNVAIGGGGYVTGIHIHPQDASLVYIQTDIGGFYRWLPAKNRWLPLTEQFPRSQFNFYGGEALALDPQNPDLVYIAVGLYRAYGEGALFKSRDRGATWEKSNLTVPMGGNEDKRWAGKRLAVSPADSNLLLFGSRQDGLWRSTNGGLDWSPVEGLAARPEDGIGVMAIAFAPGSKGRVYLSAYGDGVYESKDSGLKWQRLTNSPTQAMQLAVASDGILYATSAVSPGVSKYQHGQWQEITPKQQANAAFNGLAVAPDRSERLLVSLDQTSDTQLFLSENGGATWRLVPRQLRNGVPWLPDDFFADHTAAIAFSPQVSQQAWLTDWFGVWRTDNIDAKPARWTNLPQGHEQVVSFTLIAPPQGALLLSGVADVEGFVHERLDQFPAQRLGYGANGQHFFQDTYSIAYSPANPLVMVRVGGNRWNETYSGATSTDGGRSWQRFPYFPRNTLPLRVAVSATDPNTFIVITHDALPLKTSDGGRTWRPVKGLPKGPQGPWYWSMPLVADPVAGDRFYYYDGGILYRSEDSGDSFQRVNNTIPTTSELSILTAEPGQAANLWVSLSDKGLFRSQDGGQTFTKVLAVQHSHLLAFGLPLQPNDPPAVYLYGSLDGLTEGIYLSEDRGQSWTSIREDLTPIGTQPNVMVASQQKPGLIFIGTNGRGIYYKQLK